MKDEKIYKIWYTKIVIVKCKVGEFYMLMLICFAVVFVCGLIITINPKMGVNPEKLKNGITYEEAVKKNRTSGIILLIVGIVLFLINL